MSMELFIIIINDYSYFGGMSSQIGTVTNAYFIFSETFTSVEIKCNLQRL